MRDRRVSLARDPTNRLVVAGSGQDQRVHYRNRRKSTTAVHLLPCNPTQQTKVFCAGVPRALPRKITSSRLQEAAAAAFTKGFDLTEVAASHNSKSAHTCIRNIERQSPPRKPYRRGIQWYEVDATLAAAPCPVHISCSLMIQPFLRESAQPHPCLRYRKAGSTLACHSSSLCFSLCGIPGTEYSAMAPSLVPYGT